MPESQLHVNTGLLVGERPTDYRLGSTSPIKHEVRNSTRDWRLFRSRDERQNMNPEDRMYCVTGSGTNVWEEQANWMLANNLWPADALKFWTDNGYINFSEKIYHPITKILLAEGSFEISRRFTAKMSGTTRQGNYFYAVWDSFRKDGVAPDVKYPDDKSLSWEQYYQEIPPELKLLAKESLKYFSLLYESVGAIPAKAMLVLQEMAPLQFGITTGCGWDSEVPVCLMEPNHAVDNDHIRGDLSYDIFDSYEPFAKHLQFGYHVPICYRAVLYPVVRNSPIVSPDLLTRDAKYGDRGDEVIKVKVALAKIGWPDGMGDSYDDGMAQTVFKFQLANIDHVFLEMLFSLKGRRVGPMTRAAINNLLQKK